MRKLLVAVGLLLLLNALTGIASAKTIPYVEDPDSDWADFTAMDEVLTFDEGQFNHSLYGRLGVYGDLDVFALNFAAADDLPLDAFVPSCGAHFEHFTPTVALAGPGLERPKDADLLPFKLPQEMGALLMAVDKSHSATRMTTGASTVRVKIPAAGTYYLVVWEPDGHTGAYMVSAGESHPSFIDSDESARIGEAWDMVESGRWMGQDCDAPLTVKDCPATPSDQVGDANLDPAPVRRVVGEGYTLTGIIRDSTTCMPIADARILVWMARANGRYDDDHRATLITNLQGAYRLDSERPGNYGPEPHIHLYVTAPGYAPLMTAHFLGEGETWGEYSLNLVPEKAS